MVLESLKELSELYFETMIQQDFFIRQLLLNILETKFIVTANDEQPIETIIKKMAIVCVDNLMLLDQIRGTPHFFTFYQENLNIARTMKNLVAPNGLANFGIIACKL